MLLHTSSQLTICLISFGAEFAAALATPGQSASDVEGCQARKAPSGIDVIVVDEDDLFSEKGLRNDLLGKACLTVSIIAVI